MKSANRFLSSSPALYNADRVATNHFRPIKKLPNSQFQQDKARFLQDQTNKMAKTAEKKVTQSGGNMMISKRQWEMTDEIKCLTAMQDDYTKTKEDYNQLEVFHGKLQEKYDGDIKLKEATIAVQSQRIDELSKALSDSGLKVTAINEDLKKQVIDATETYLQRTWKFVEDDMDIIEATKEVIPYLPHPLTMEEEEFVANYGKAVNTGLKNMRQNVQSECKKCAQGTYSSVCLHGNYGMTH